MSKVGDLLRKVLSWISNLLNDIPEDLKHYATIALKVTTAIKKAADSGIVISITEATAMIEDDAIRAAISTCLGSFNHWLENLIGMTPKMRNAVLIKLASELTACLDNGELKENQYDIAVQAVYSSQHTA